MKRCTVQKKTKTKVNNEFYVHSEKYNEMKSVKDALTIFHSYHSIWDSRKKLNPSVHIINAE